MNPNGNPRPAGVPALGDGGGGATTAGTLATGIGAAGAPGAGTAATDGAASPMIQATIAARRGSAAGSGAPPACICPEPLASRRLDSGACGCDERADDRLVPSGIAREQEPCHPRGASRAVAGGADVHEDRVNCDGERRSTGRYDGRRGRSRGRRGNGRRGVGNRRHRRRERRGLGRPRLVALAFAVSLRPRASGPAAASSCVV